MEKIFVPPIKSQGIKTKLVGWINSNINGIEYKRWVEPFMGTGAVAFNVRPKTALLCDSNPHLINFYKSLQTKEISSGIVKSFLTEEGNNLLKSNGEHYYIVRDRFNKNGNPLDFLFLSRACFNGMMRFNKNGGFNVPFCRKPNRFAQALVTKISNQVEYISEIISYSDYTFLNQDFKETLKQINPSDLVYADPPYLGRHVDYFDSWSEEDEIALNNGLKNSNAKYILSTWLSNKYRTNNYIFSVWKDCRISTKEHFYHVGAKEDNRNAVYEAILSNFEMSDSIANSTMKKRIENNESQLTTKVKTYSTPVQMSLVLEEEKSAKLLK
ncbi:MAG TPA: DNA adenine methylase [Marinilabiliales bacterium]|nr:MAG: DNA adenine methylase [Bacteroidetes bacterium GWC2_40_13]OFX73570.1 MAG: DNA adenine methylase [Bacteroidetes bacterium GWD2_40_43]OFX90755.1 MAG: DNA adenine methylase [Bacteroidetes bacterium GWE2_40_63]OFY20613.1 MAG: DNA adenine methylase [Bacteroidetes bacterium GWF2_40_13]OFZ24672.1 MAG: DNA adenine methylase [Bacteroidetes bacterium RIFOXYC2_FULL_40_12]HAN00530.1 DNA adenine methylase [Marinilabiliales bacterium]